MITWKPLTEACYEENIYVHMYQTHDNYDKITVETTRAKNPKCHLYILSTLTWWIIALRIADMYVDVYTYCT